MSGAQILQNLRMDNVEQQQIQPETQGTHVVAKYLGHCGASPNRYVLHRGTETECQAFFEGLPHANKDSLCQHCGDYAWTGDVQDACHIEAA